jgi:hypothetical protein
VGDAGAPLGAVAAAPAPAPAVPTGGAADLGAASAVPPCAMTNTATHHVPAVLTKTLPSLSQFRRALEQIHRVESSHVTRPLAGPVADRLADIVCPRRVVAGGVAVETVRPQ